MSNGVTDQGFVRPRLVDIKTQIEDVLKTNIDASVDLTPASVFGQLVGIFAEREDLVWQAMEDVYNSQYPDTAFGESLDNVGAISGVPRLGALSSTVAAQRLFGTIGTLVPAGTQFSVNGNPNAIFATQSDVALGTGTDMVQKVTFSAIPTVGQFKLSWYGQETALINWNDSIGVIQSKFQALPFASGVLVTGSISPTGLTFTFAGVSGKQEWPAMVVASNTLQILLVPITTAVTILTAGVNQGVVACSAITTGPTVANAGTLTVINTPVSGLSSTINVLDALVGRDIETDNEYRARRAQELQIAGAGTVEAIRAKLLTVANVTAVIVFENVTEIPDPDGRPPKSFEAIVQGGDDQDIADELWAVKPAGIRTDGLVVKQVTDSQGLIHDIKFSRPTDLDIYIDITVTINPNFPANGVAGIKQALVDAGNALGIGKEVVVIPYLISAIATIPGIEDAVLLIGTAPSPTLSDNIPVAPNEIAVFDTTRVNVTTV